MALHRHRLRRVPPARLDLQPRRPEPHRDREKTAGERGRLLSPGLVCSHDLGLGDVREDLHRYAKFHSILEHFSRIGGNHLHRFQFVVCPIRSGSRGDA